MTSRDFAYWLQGFFEVANPKELKETELTVIKNHLNMVFKHEIDPSITTDPVKINELNFLHNHPSLPNDVTVRC